MPLAVSLWYLSLHCAFISRFEVLKRADEDGDYLDLLELLTGMVMMSQTEPFSEKIRYLLTIFDFDNNRFIDSHEMIEMLTVCLSFLTHIGFLRVHIHRDEVESIVLRTFYMEGIDPQQGMTIYEAKEWLRTLTSRSRAIAALLDCTWQNAELSTFQRQSMPGLHQYEKGILTITDLKYYLAHAAIIFRPLLSSDNKLAMHERAMARGAEDPLKPDYSRFLPKQSKKTLAQVVPLVHGHLGSLNEWRRVEANRVAAKLQAAFRGSKGRMVAEMRAKVKAFEKAREATLEKVREKVKREVLGKEDLTGMDKLKHDAKIRNRAAKMRAAGLPCEREDVLAAMIKEGMETGERGVRLRFLEIAKEKGLLPYLDNPEEGIKKEVAVDVVQSMAVVSQKAVDAHLKKDETVELEVEKPDNYINLPGKHCPCMIIVVASNVAARSLTSNLSPLL